MSDRTCARCVHMDDIGDDERNEFHVREGYVGTCRYHAPTIAWPTIILLGSNGLDNRAEMDRFVAKVEQAVMGPGRGRFPLVKGHWRCRHWYDGETPF